MVRTLEDRLDILIARLGDEDEQSVRSAGDQLLDIGEPAVARLITVLEHGEPEVRKAASFLLGRLAGREISGGRRQREQRARELAALRHALADDEPKVRKNAAVALGKVSAGKVSAGKVSADEGSEGEDATATVSALADALEAETITWVRPSLILALGAVGGGAARQALGRVRPDSEREAEALRKAQDRVRPEAPEVTWRSGVATPVPIWASVPVGLEDVAREEAEEALLRVGPVDEGGGGAGAAPAGRIRLTAGAPTAKVLSRLRCVEDLRLLLAEAPPLHDVAHGELPGRVAALLTASPVLSAWRRFLESEEDTLHYRFALDDLRLPKGVFFEVLGAVRDGLAPLGLADSPSNYSAQLTVEAGRDATRVWLIPTFLPDERFAYRREDVGASVHPVVAAGLVRLLRGPVDHPADGADAGGGGHHRTVFDPTCGSATLLIERAKLAPGRLGGSGGEGATLHLRGIDVSPTAVRAAQVNLRAAELAGRINVDRADATDPRSWSPVDEVIANLPFGRRSKRQDVDLERLYHRLAGHLAEALRPGGRALLYTSNRDLMDQALARHAGDLRLSDRRNVEAGGIRVGAWLLTR